MMPTSRSLDSLRAALLLGLACAADATLRFVVALPLVAAALVVSYHALTSRTTKTADTVPGSVWMLLAAMAASGIVAASPGGPLWFEVVRRGFAASGVIVVGLVAGPDPVWRRRGLAWAVGGATLLCFVTPAAVPHPEIDVVPWTTTAVRALLSGVHPYTVQAPDVYGGARDFGFVVRVYPYMPATLLVFAPFVLVFGDFRYALAACLPVTVWLVRRTGRRGGAPLALVDAATLTLVLNPVGLLMVRSGWTEPLLCVLAALFALAVVQRWPIVPAVTMALLPSLKQYVLAPAILWASGIGRRAPRWAWIIAAALALATVAPFLMWNARATTDGMLFQMRAPMRPRLTSISVPGLLANLSEWNLPIWLSAVSQIVVSAAIALSGAASRASVVLLGSAIALLVTFLLGWQGFINYYVFIGNLLVQSAILAAVEQRCA